MFLEISGLYEENFCCKIFESLHKNSLTCIKKRNKLLSLSISSNLFIYIVNLIKNKIVTEKIFSLGLLLFR